MLVQGHATVEKLDRAWLESITPQWERFLGPRHEGRAGRFMDIYYWQRVAITVRISRIVILEGTTRSRTTVIGSALPAAPPAPQSPPAKGTGPRVDSAKVAHHVNRLPQSVLGWVGSDGLPIMIPVSGATADGNGVHLATAGDLDPPRGGRRAGLTSHAFRPRMIGQEQRVHTGWLDVDERRTHYAPHTKAGYAMPASRTLFALGVGIGMRRGFRRAQESGITT